jgi:hypothetical protein
MATNGVSREQAVSGRSMNLVYHGSWRGVSGLGLDLPPDHPGYRKNGVCHTGLGKTENAEVWFAPNLSKAFEYAVDGCTDPRGGVIYGVEPDEAGLQKDGINYVSHGRVPREHIRLVMIPAHPSILDRIMETARKTKQMLPDAKIILYQYADTQDDDQYYDKDTSFPIRTWDAF